MGKSVSDYMKIAWGIFGKKVVNRMVSEKAGHSCKYPWLIFVV